MKHYVITIEGDTYELRDQVARALASQKQIKCYNEELLELVAKESEIPLEALKKYDEKSNKSIALYHQGAYDESLMANFDNSYEEQGFILTSKKILKIATEESCVIVGHLSNYILSNMPSVMRIRLADSKAKIDKKRLQYYHYYVGEAWGQSTQYDLILNVAKKSVPEVVAEINLFVDTIKESS